VAGTTSYGWFFPANFTDSIENTQTLSFLGGIIFFDDTHWPTLAPYLQEFEPNWICRCFRRKKSHISKCQKWLAFFGSYRLKR
jgi:hypothetical protein